VDGVNSGKSITTSSAGSYSFTALQQAGFTVNTSAGDYASQSKGVSLTSNQTLSFRLNRTTSRVQPMAFELTGAATDDEGRPVANADLYLDFTVSDVPGTFYAHASGVTNGAGFYRIGFTAVPNAMAHGSTAFACLRGKSGYTDDCQWIPATTHDAFRSFRLNRIKRIAAGESTSVTVAPDDTVCVNNVQDSPGLGQDYVCRSVLIVAPADGLMTVEALPTQGGGRPPLEVETRGAAGPCCNERMGNPTSIPVTAGTEVVANIEMAWGSTTSQSFTLNTTLVRQ
jgi:hypothetical protein